MKRLLTNRLIVVSLSSTVAIKAQDVKFISPIDAVFAGIGQSLGERLNFDFPANTGEARAEPSRTTRENGNVLRAIVGGVANK